MKNLQVTCQLLHVMCCFKCKISEDIHRETFATITPFKKSASSASKRDHGANTPFLMQQQSQQSAMPPFGSNLVMLLALASLAASCTEEDSYSLLQFLAGLSQNSGLTKSWQKGTDCCSWEGISCSPERTVTDVFLASRNLQGFISPLLGNLTGLLRLNLSFNLLSGNLPLELVASTSIIVLDVSFNQLSGDLPDIPSSTPAWPLQVLNISSNKFTGRFPSTSWEVMKNLAALNASNNSFIGKIPTVFCVSAPYFAVLELSYNQFSGSIPLGLGNCSMLTSLSAGHNNLIGILPDELFNIKLLKQLSFPNNQLEGSLHSISKLTNLVILDLGGNELQGNIPDSIGELKRLEEIHLDYNHMSGELPSTLGGCTNLKSINLMSNGFSGELTRVNFSTLPNLHTLDLVRNNFTGTIPESIYSCSNLVALRLSVNKFSGQLSEGIASLNSLSFLSIGNNYLTNITSALQILSSCRNLTTLLIGYNFMDEDMPDDDKIDGFKSIRVLALNSCSLSGKIPNWLLKFTNLEMLFLFDNQLTGSIPDWINSLNFLYHIDISNNSLTGEIPTALIEMPMLKTEKVAPKVFELPVYNRELQYRMPSAFPKALRLGSNKITGAIPPEIGDLKALAVLDLSSNRLYGEIPQSICNLTSLQTLDLSRNSLRGAIPESLNKLHFLSAFNVSNNDLEGPIPTGGQFDTFGTSSYAGNENLCGTLLSHDCNSSEVVPSISRLSTNQCSYKGTFAIGFSVFFGVGVMLDQIVLPRF